jgi:RNA polymerase sigma factor (sigma-70 family)
MQVGHQALQKDSLGFAPSFIHKNIDDKKLTQLIYKVALERDKQAFTVLFRFFAPKILGISKSKFANADQANEVLQETMSNVWRKAHYFNADRGAPTTWIYTIMRNVTFDLLRKVQSNKEDNLSGDIWPLAEQCQADSHLSTDSFDDHLSKNEIMSCLDILPKDQKMVIRGFYFLDMSQEKLAKQLDLPLGTIKSRLRLALGKLKVQLGEKHD